MVDADAALAERMHALAGRRAVFFAGLPGTGKSLLVHQLAHVAAASGRVVHLLQWDVARPAFEACAAGRRYPPVAGVTHAVLRRAAGRWAREALADWGARHPGPEPLLVGETPLVGNRFVELAQRLDDRAEPLLAAESCRFVLAVPSIEVRRVLEATRERRAVTPLHHREREDAPPQVLRELWREVLAVAPRLGVAPPDDPRRENPGAYDPVVYRRVFETILRHRHVEVVALDVVLPTERLSVYDFAVATHALVPTEAEAEAVVRRVERDHPDPATAEQEAADWWRV